MGYLISGGMTRKTSPRSGLPAPVADLGARHPPTIAFRSPIDGVSLEMPAIGGEASLEVALKSGALRRIAKAMNAAFSARPMDHQRRIDRLLDAQRGAAFHEEPVDG